MNKQHTQERAFARLLDRWNVCRSEPHCTRSKTGTIFLSLVSISYSINDVVFDLLNPSRLKTDVNNSNRVSDCLAAQLLDNQTQGQKGLVDCLWPSALWRHRTLSILFQVMACCLMATMLTSHQWGLLAITSRQFQRKCSRYLDLISVWKWLT